MCCLGIWGVGKGFWVERNEMEGCLDLGFFRWFSWIIFLGECVFCTRYRGSGCSFSSPKASILIPKTPVSRRANWVENSAVKQESCSIVASFSTIA